MNNRPLFVSITALFILITSCNKLKVTPDYANGWDQIGDLNADSGLGPIAADHIGYVYVAGYFPGSADKYHIEKWNGIKWSELGSLNAQSAITSLAVDGNNNIFASVDATATDSGYIAEWNGSSWNKLIDTTNGKIIGAHISSMVAAGAQYLYVLVNNKEVDRWDGGTWTNLTDTVSLFANSNIYSLTSDLSAAIYVGINAAGPGAHPGVAIWDGTSWKELGALSPNNKIYVVSSDIHGNKYAAGSFTNKSGKTYVAIWDGSKWYELAGLNMIYTTGDIRCLATDINGNVYAAGYLLDDAGNYYVAKWNGRSWAKLNTGIPLNGPVLSITLDKQGGLYAVSYSNSSRKSFVALWSQ